MLGATPERTGPKLRYHHEGRFANTAVDDRSTIQDVLVKTRVLILAAALACSASSACRKAPLAEQTASAQAPAQPEQPPAPPKPLPDPLPDVLARVNGQPVTKADFDRLIKNLEATRGPIPAERRNEVLREALDQLITYTVMKQEAASRNLTIPDAEIDGRVRQMQGQMSKEQFDKALADRNTSAEQLRSDARADMMIDKMMQGELATTAPADEIEAKGFYDKNPEKFKQGEAVRASHILVMADEKADEATKAKARAKIDGVLKRARAGEDFAALAKQNSDDGSKGQGGDLGFFQKGQMVPAFDQVAFALKPGEISDVVTTQFGYHIIKMAERKEASTIPYDAVKARIVEYLNNQKKQQRVDQFVEEAKKRARIEVLV
jgi:peptidyl-prolyl cis-trans isomerase C